MTADEAVAAGRVDGCAHPRQGVTSLLRTRDYITGRPFEIGECAACGLVVTVPRPDAASIAEFYPAEYYGDPGSARFPAIVDGLLGALCASRARLVERLAGGRAGRVLDVGCGRGLLLAAFRRRGWEVHGTELTNGAAAFARKALGVPVHVGGVESWPWPEGHFDVVTLWHSLEHQPVPGAVLHHAHRLLRPGGVLALSVPNFASAEARAARAAWFHLDVPRHLVHFTPASLARELRRAGFEVRRVSFFAPEFDVFSFVQSAQNAMGLRHNLLYGLLRRRSARLVQAGALEVLAVVALALPLGLAAIPATALVSLARRGSSMTSYAVRCD